MLKAFSHIVAFLAPLFIAAAFAQPAPAPVKAGALQIEAPWLRATPGGAKVGAGYLRITNTGSEADRLIGASMPLAARGEVHEMSMQNGVMKMRGLDSGLMIEPGKTIELKPGGYHLMFLDLKDALKQGQNVDVTLSFEKAGNVTIAFPVQGLGGPSHM
ncbi:MAG: copper chaperone PCu(A)C [Methylobacteriaceae bacterium]|nr:copper chaperone PCu(A)C [Methylobacteriaceae bacterium]